MLNLPCGEWVHVDRENVGIGVLLSGLDGPVNELVCRRRVEFPPRLTMLLSLICEMVSSTISSSRSAVPNFQDFAWFTQIYGGQFMVKIFGDSVVLSVESNDIALGNSNKLLVNFIPIPFSSVGLYQLVEIYISTR